MNPIGEILLALLDDAGSGLSLPELLCRDAARRLPVEGCAISLMDAHGVHASVFASDAWCRSLIDLEESLGEGPHRDAFARGRLIVVTDVGRDSDRWPAYAREATVLGARAVFAHPLRVGGIRLGVLGLIATRTGMLERDDLALALRYVDAAVMVLLQQQQTADWDLDGDHGGLDGARRPRLSVFDADFHGQPEIHQATGMISVQVGTGLGEALALLRARAFAEGRPILEVARDVVDRRTSFT